MFWFLAALLVVVIAAPFGVGAVRWARNQRGSAVLITSVLLIFGLDMQITPPPPPATELTVRQAEDDEPKD